jgi:hypothetical protein
VAFFRNIRQLAIPAVAKGDFGVRSGGDVFDSEGVVQYLDVDL